MPKNKWMISFDLQGMRLLAFLKKKLGQYSNQQIKKVIEEGYCLVNDQVQCFSTYVLKEKDRIQLRIGWKDIWKRKEEVVTIEYEDPAFYIINKPTDIECTEKELSRFFSAPIFLVHRLDKKTSGLLIIAKNPGIQKIFEDMFKNNAVKKFYLAAVDKKVRFKTKKVTSLLTRKYSFQGQSVYHSAKTGKKAVTIFHCILAKDQYSVLLCMPITGRTHQIRVHLREMHHPILGDFLYAKRYAYLQHPKRLMLHSIALAFLHPQTKEKMRFISQIPKEFLSFLKKSSISFLNNLLKKQL